MDISNQQYKISLENFKNMVERVNKFILKKKREPKIVYINPTNSTFYVTYQRYQDMLQRYRQFIQENGREPRYISVAPASLSTSKKQHFGFWLLKANMEEVELSKIHVTDIFLSEAALQTERTEKFIKTAKNEDVRVHAWIQCLKDKDGWHTPDASILSRIINKVQKAVNMGFDGVHLDYIRYPGTAYQYQNASQQIVDIIKNVYGRIKISPQDIFISATVMPEKSMNAYYYGQDYELMGQWLDALIPMAYKGNYKAKSEWIGEVVKYIKNRTDKSVWAGIQSYHSDENTTPLSVEELKKDIEIAFSAGADGCILFRYGLINSKILGG